MSKLDLSTGFHVVFDPVKWKMKYYQNGEEYDVPCFKIQFQTPSSEAKIEKWPGKKNERNTQWNEANPEKKEKKFKRKSWAYRWIDTRFEKNQWYTTYTPNGDIYEIHATSAFIYSENEEDYVELRGPSDTAKKNGKLVDSKHSIHSITCCSKTKIQNSAFVNNK